MRLSKFCVALAVFAASVVFGYATAFAASVEKGKAAFVTYGCWQCHGFQGQGSVATSNGKVLAPDPMPFETLSAFVRSSNGPMPPYTEKVLPNEDLADIYAYLSSISKTVDYKTIPLLNP